MAADLASNRIASTAVHRVAFGRFGERIAADFLKRRGARILARNIKVGRGEIDLIVSVEGRQVAVEVKSAMEQEIGHAADSFTRAKAVQVRALADRLGIARVDLVTVTVGPGGVDVVWTARAA